MSSIGIALIEAARRGGNPLLRQWILMSSARKTVQDFTENALSDSKCLAI